MNNFVIDTPDNFWQIRWLDKYMEGHKGAFNRCSACVEIMANDDNGFSMIHYIDYEDIIGVELIKN